ncbi:MAG: serine hydrolase [Bacteroidota bacterium]|nr:serine hydrolase [Bacteroidota bacterium]MDP4218181.1 serine hydrolase [Bacteroidota bacterium]MDP4247915.1 serine hydrolase [Bacteroidota bacterium]MDP4253070.1 serine hydrolase [Bacteroidota bacterium]MDP4260217.1 serine hydrolase [Bacteroidota bacterium]
MNRSLRKLGHRLGLAVAIVSTVIRLSAQEPAAFPATSPEAQGVSSQAIVNFLDAIPASGSEFHSFMILRHGYVIAQGWWSPYAPELKHTLYSLSKSFTATAVGFAVSEKRLSVDDKVISFFPKTELPDTISAYLRALRVRDLLTMSVGMEPEPSAVVRSNVDWVKAFCATPVVHEPGTKFLYSSVATYMLSAIVQKVTGQRVIDYLRPRLFEPLGISGMDWETSPDGINTGGWGLRLKTEDLAKFGELFLEKGKWKGRQVVPRDWIEAASTKKIDQDPDAPQAKKDSSDWLQGYCYQMWRCRNNAYRGDGAFGQYVIVMPDQDAVIAITSESRNMQSEINLVWKYLLPGFHEKPFAEDVRVAGILRKKLGSLALPPEQAGNSGLQASLSGKTYAIERGKELKSAHFEFKNGHCLLTLKTDTSSYLLSFGHGEWVKGSTDLPGPYLVTARGNRVGLAPYLIEGSYGWADEKTLELKLRYIESPHTETIRCVFGEPAVAAAGQVQGPGQVQIELSRSFDDVKVTGTGVLSH